MFPPPEIFDVFFLIPVQKFEIIKYDRNQGKIHRSEEFFADIFIAQGILEGQIELVRVADSCETAVFRSNAGWARFSPASTKYVDIKETFQFSDQIFPLAGSITMGDDQGGEFSFLAGQINPGLVFLVN